MSCSPEEPPIIFLNAALKERLGIVYAIGGAHWRLGAPLERRAVIDSFHRQNMMLARHPLVDIVAHPWWWHGGWEGADGMYAGPPWLDDFAAIPNDYHRKFAEAVKAHGKAVEINAEAIFLNPGYTRRFKDQYLGYLRRLRDWGVRFAVGSDAHDPSYRGALSQLAGELRALELSADDLWRPSCLR